MGLKDANLYLPNHEALTAAGFAILIFDYRGFGDSGGRTDLVIPAMQLEDLINAVTYLASRDDIDSDNIGTFGSGGTGGGNAIVLAASDPRIGCTVSQVPVATERTGCIGCAASTSGSRSSNALQPTGLPGSQPARGRWSTPPREDHGPNARASCHQRQG